MTYDWTALLFIYSSLRQSNKANDTTVIVTVRGGQTEPYYLGESTDTAGQTLPLYKL